MTVASPAAPSAPPSPFAVLRKRAFVYLWTGQLVSTIGDALTSLAAGILVFRATGSVLNVGLMLMATAAPTLVFGLIAGVFVDRFDRKRIMIAADLLRAALVALIPLLVGINIIWLYVIVMLSASVTQFFAPANESVLPEIASDEELGAANAIMAIAQFGSTAIGFALAGLLAASQSIEVVFWLDSGTFLFSALMISLVRIAPFVSEGRTRIGDVVRNLGVGARYIAATPILRSLVTLRVPVMLIFGMQNVLLLPMAIQVLGGTEFEYGLQEGLTSVGFVVGSLFMARLADRLREGQWLVLSFLGMGLAGLAYALSPQIWVAVAIIGVSGFLNAPSFVAGRLINQRNTPRELRGRVFSTQYVIRDVVYLGGMGLAGAADLFGARPLFIISSVTLVGTALAASLLPGIGQPAAEWRRALTLLRAAPQAAGLGLGRPAGMADVDLLASFVPALSGLTPRERDALVSRSRVVDAPEGTAITRAGDPGSAAYFVLSGRAVAGSTSGEGEHRSLSSMGRGDVFGEIAALTGSPRTADVVAAEPTTLLEVPAESLRRLMARPDFGALVLGKMQERLARSASLSDLPRFGGIDQRVLRQLRTEVATEEVSGTA